MKKKRMLSEAGQAFLESLLSLPIILSLFAVLAAALVHAFFEFQLVFIKNEFNVCLRSQMSQQNCLFLARDQIKRIDQVLGLQSQLSLGAQSDTWTVKTKWVGWKTFNSPAVRTQH